MDATIKKICAGDVRAASRLIRDIEDKRPDAKVKIKKLYAHTGKSFIIGITGAPGAGKSTLTDALISEFRKLNKTVGVLAVDPTSPFTGGAILGDRIRMQRHAADDGVFVRSLATRGALGGLSQAAGNAIHVIEAMGKDIIIVETVGIGQQEIDIINHAHSVVVVLVPGMGDEIQTMKAGLMEIADVFVINKANRPGTGQLQTELSSMLNLSPKTLTAGSRRSPWWAMRLNGQPLTKTPPNWRGKLKNIIVSWNKAANSPKECIAKSWPKLKTRSAPASWNP